MVQGTKEKQKEEHPILGPVSLNQACQGTEMDT
jgi:hypothetical protein